MNVSQDERERTIFRSRRKFQTDLQSDFATAEDRGRNIRKQEGRLEVARNVLRMGMSIDDIVKLTGLTHEEIQGLPI